MKKRLLSAFMALALCLTLLPAPAWAAETEGGAAQIGDTVYSTLPDAVNAAQDGDTIKLLADYKTAEGSGGEEESGLTIRKSVTLDLNGHGMDDFRVVQVNDAAETLPSGNLTVEDTSAEKTGKVTGTIELLAGKLTINGGTIGDGRDGVSIENGNLIVNGGAIDYLYGSNSGTVKIAGGTVKNAQLVGDFEITVTGGSLTLMVIIILWLSGIASAFVDNIPFAATMVPVITSLSATMGVDLNALAWTLSIGTDVGGSATPIGASANVVLSGISTRHGFPITFASYLKVGFPMMLVSVAISTVFLLIRFG